jgi:pSer/pThr/pTyr-binding forkhead associated (FHA) protein
MAVLKITSGPEEGRVLELEVGENVIGRGPDARIVIGHASVSKRHASVYAECRWFVSDLDSKNLTLHNNAEVELGKPCELAHGDRLAFGEVTAVFAPQAPSRALEEAGEALEAANRSIASLRAELEACRLADVERDAALAARDEALARRDAEYAELLRRVDPDAYLTRAQFEEEKRAFELAVKADAQRQIDAFSRRALDLEQRYVKASAAQETLQRQLQAREDQLRLATERLAAR